MCSLVAFLGAAQVLYRVPGVETVRGQERDGGITLWIQGNNLSEQAMEALVDHGIALHRAFPAFSPLLEIHDHFGRGGWHKSFGLDLAGLHHLLEVCDEMAESRRRANTVILGKRDNG